MKKNYLTYKKSGVDYDLIDPIKRLAQEEGLKTKKNLQKTEYREVTESRGETAYIIESSDCFYAFVEEGLGSKNLVADEMRKITGKTYYDAIAYDTVVSIVMDLITVGAKPLTVLSYWATGDSKWFTDSKRSSDFVIGWKKACDDLGVTWGGGETPVLKDIIYQETIDLAGSAFGIIKPKKKIILGDQLAAGDAIILIESSGIHINGLTLARALAKKLPRGFATRFANGKMYGEELLTPTLIYQGIIEEIQEASIDIHYLVNITGHGWRKLMRANKSLSYRLDIIPQVPEIFRFIQKYSGLRNEEMYATFNMGAGFAIYVSSRDVKKVLKIIKKHNLKGWLAGKVESGPRSVNIKPLDILYRIKELGIR